MSEETTNGTATNAKRVDDLDSVFCGSAKDGGIKLYVNTNEQCKEEMLVRLELLADVLDAMRERVNNK